MKSFHDRIARIYYTYGLFCASHPIATIVTVILLGLFTCWPLSNIPLPGNSPLQYRAPIAGNKATEVDSSNSSYDDLKAPRWHHGQSVAYIQQIVMKSVVSPWHPNQMVTSDAFRAPLASVFPLLQLINNFKYIDKNKVYSVEDVCYRVSEPINAQHHQGHLPDYACLILSPGNFWRNNVERFNKDVSVLETIYKRCGQTVESPPAIKDLLFGIPWMLTGISKYYIRNRQRVISYAVTLVLNDHDAHFISGLKSKLESHYPATIKNVNNSHVGDVVHVHFKDSNYFVEYTPLLVTYFVLLMYLYFSVCKIDFVKSKIGLAFSAVFTVFSSLLMSVSICTFFGLAPTLNGGEIFPYLVVIVGVENVLVITKSVVSTPVHLDVKFRVAQGLSKEGWSITKNLLSELLIVFFGFMTFVPAIQEFATFALVGILSDFLLQMFFFAPVLSLDIRRMELSDLHRQSVNQAVQEDSSFNAINIQPMMLCPFAPNRHNNKKSSISPSSSSNIITKNWANQDHRRSANSSKTDRPKYEMPRRVKFFYFLARFRIIQKFIMVCTVVWIVLISHKVGLVAKLTGDESPVIAKSINSTNFQELPETVRHEEEKLLYQSGNNREEHVRLGPVEHIHLETWDKLSYKHWPTLFHYYNVSLFGRYITVLPTIHLSEVVDPQTAIKMRHPSDMSSHLWQPHSVSGQTEISSSDPVVEDNDSHDIDDGIMPHYQKLNNFYPKSQQEFVITICLCFLSVIVITYFMITLYKCMCSRNYSRWRHSWGKYNRRRTKGYFKQIKESVPLSLTGHDQSIECLWSDNGLIISCCLGGQLKLWDSNTGDCMNTIKRKSFVPKPYSVGNIDDSDVDLYAEYHDGLSRNSSYSSLLEGDEVRIRKGKPEVKVSSSPDRYDEPDLSSFINTKFSVLEPQAHVTSSDGYDFTRWLGDDIFEKPQPVEENENSRDSRNQSYSDLSLLSPIENMSRSWSAGDQSGMDMALMEEDTTFESASSVWCLASLHGLIITGCGNGRIEVWDADTGELRYHHSISDVGVTGLLVVGGRIVAARLDGSVDFLEMETLHNPIKVQMSSPQTPRKKKGHTRYHSLGSNASGTKMWDEVIQCSGVTTCRAHRQPINCIQCQGGRIVTASQDHTLKVFRLDNCLCLYTLHGHEGSVTALCLDKVAPYAAVSGSVDGTVRIWDLLSGTCVHKFRWHEATVVSISSSALYIVSVGLDERMCVWDRTKAMLLHTIQQDQGGVSSAALMSMNHIVTGGQGGICLWDIPRGCLLRRVVFSDSEQQAFINHVVSIGNHGIVCDYGSKLKVVYFPTILEKAE